MRQSRPYIAFVYNGPEIGHDQPVVDNERARASAAGITPYGNLLLHLRRDATNKTVHATHQGRQQRANPYLGVAESKHFPGQLQPAHTRAHNLLQAEAQTANFEKNVTGLCNQQPTSGTYWGRCFANLVLCR